MNEFRGVAAAIVLLALPFVAGIGVGRASGRWRWPAGALFFVATAAALVIGHLLTDRNRAGYRVLTVVVELPFAVGAVVAAVVGTIAGVALGKRLRRPR